MDQLQSQQPELFDIIIKIISTKPLSTCTVDLFSSVNGDHQFSYSFELIPRVSLETYVSTAIAIFNSQKLEDHEKHS